MPVLQPALEAMETNNPRLSLDHFIAINVNGNYSGNKILPLPHSWEKNPQIVIDQAFNS